MTLLSRRTMLRYVKQAQLATSAADKGKALEALIAYTFSRVPGIAIARRDALNVFSSEEIDIAFWNDQFPRGLYFLPNIILVECKNWSNPVGAAEVSWFDNKLQRRARTHGVLVASNGITGNSDDVTAAHDIIRNGLAAGRHMIVLTQEEILSMGDTSALVRLLKEKLCELVVSGTVILSA